MSHNYVYIFLNTKMLGNQKRVVHKIIKDETKHRL